MSKKIEVTITRSVREVTTYLVDEGKLGPATVEFLDEVSDTNYGLAFGDDEGIAEHCEIIEGVGLPVTGSIERYDADEPDYSITYTAEEG